MTQDNRRLGSGFSRRWTSSFPLIVGGEQETSEKDQMRRHFGCDLDKKTLYFMNSPLSRVCTILYGG